MQEIIFENPIVPVLGCLIFAAVLGYGWLNSGYKSILAASIALLVAAVILVFTAMTVKTDREQVRETMDEIATNLERNEYDAIYARMHPLATQAVLQAKGELPRYRFESARVSRVKEINVQANQNPPRAEAKFNVVVRVLVEGQMISVPQYVEVIFYKSGDRWLVHDYVHSNPADGFMSQ